jgi:hypothetical protein
MTTIGHEIWNFLNFLNYKITVEAAECHKLDY